MDSELRVLPDRHTADPLSLLEKVSLPSRIEALQAQQNTISRTNS